MTGQTTVKNVENFIRTFGYCPICPLESVGFLAWQRTRDGQSLRPSTFTTGTFVKGRKVYASQHIKEQHPAELQMMLEGWGVVARSGGSLPVLTSEDRKKLRQFTAQALETRPVTGSISLSALAAYKVEYNTFVDSWFSTGPMCKPAAKPLAPYPESGPSSKGKEKETTPILNTDVDQALSAAVRSSNKRNFIDVDNPATSSSSGTGNPAPGPSPAAPPFTSATTPVVGYNGEHSSAHGTFGTPAQQLGAAGMFDPNKLDPYGDLAPPVFMNQLYQCASFVQNERLYVLQYLQELRAQGRSPPTEVLEQRYPWLYDDVRGTQLEPPSWALFRSLHCYLDDERGLLVAAQEGVPVSGGSSSVGTTQPTLDATAGQTASAGGGGGTSAGPRAAPLSSAQQSGEARRSSDSASRNSPAAPTSQQAGAKTSAQASTITAFFKPKPK